MVKENPTWRTLAKTADRIRSGLEPVFAIKEHIDDWNRNREASLFLDEPEFFSDTEQHWLNAWLAGAAEYEAFLIKQKPPAWTLQADRFLKTPFIQGGENGRRYALIETPFSWRRRMVFTGKTTIL